jgi:TPR repeat protein
VLLGICVSAAVAAAALKYRSYYAARGGNARPAAVAAQAPKNDPQQQAAAATIASPMRSSGEDIFSEGSSYRARSAKSSPGKEVAATYSYTQPRSGPAGTRNAKAPGATRTSDPLRYSQNPTQSKQKTPEQLWKEVQAGNSQAAVELASLYLKGQGVRQNCQQARVLLLVASAKRDAVAIKKLHELDKGPTTCQ